MSNEIVVPIVTGAAGVVFGAVSVWWRSSLELLVRYDLDLREKRLSEYPWLWKAVASLEPNRSNADLAAIDLVQLAQDMHGWYAGEGGLLLSRKSRQEYIRLQKAIGGYAQTADNDLHRIATIASGLRTALTEDVLTRRGSVFSADRFAK